jgi:hypothetical protein
MNQPITLQNPAIKHHNDWLVLAEIYSRAGENYLKCSQDNSAFKCFKASADILETIADSINEELESLCSQL